LGVTVGLTVSPWSLFAEVVLLITYLTKGALKVPCAAPRSTLSCNTLQESVQAVFIFFTAWSALLALQITMRLRLWTLYTGATEVGRTAVSLFTTLLPFTVRIAVTGRTTAQAMADHAAWASGVISAARLTEVKIVTETISTAVAVLITIPQRSTLSPDRDTGHPTTQLHALIAGADVLAGALTLTGPQAVVHSQLPQRVAEVRMAGTTSVEIGV